MNGNDRFPQVFWGLAVLALAFVMLGLLAVRAVRMAKRSSDVITVTGSARKTVRSDYVTWSASYYSNEMTISKAYEGITRHAARVKEFLHSRHVPDSLVEFSAVNKRDMMKQKRGMKGEYDEEFIGYQLTQKFTVHSTQVDSIEVIARDITSLAAEDFPVASEAPQFYYTKLPEMRIELLGEASKDARQRALQIAQNGGGKIGAIRNAHMGVFQITPPNSRQVSDYGIYDTSTIPKDITAVVSVRFAVE